MKMVRPLGRTVACWPGTAGSQSKRGQFARQAGLCQRLSVSRCLWLLCLEPGASSHAMRLLLTRPRGPRPAGRTHWTVNVAVLQQHCRHLPTLLDKGSPSPGRSAAGVTWVR
jgi:hypothetical protein